MTQPRKSATVGRSGADGSATGSAVEAGPVLRSGAEVRLRRLAAASIAHPESQPTTCPPAKLREAGRPEASGSA